MLNQEDSDLDDLRDIPVFKPILRAIIRSQMKHLVKQLSRHGGEEAMLLTASISDSSFDYLGSDVAEGFLDSRREIRDQFLDYCIKGVNEANSNDDTKDEDEKSKDKASPGKSPRNSRRQTGTARQASKSAVSPVSLTEVDQKTGARTVVAKGGSTVSCTKSGRKRPGDVVIAGKPPKRSTISETVSEALKDISDETEVVDDHGDPDYTPTENADSSDTMSLDLGAGTKDVNDRMKEFNETQQPGPNFDLQDFAEVKVEPTHDDEVPDFEENADQLDFDIDTKGAGAAADDGDLSAEAVVKKEKKRRKPSVKTTPLEPIVVCKYCGKTYLRAERGVKRLQSHEQLHIERPPTMCKYCGKVYKDPRLLRQHEHRHLGTEPIKCEICGFGLFDMSHYKRHMDSHTGVRNVMCSRCGKGFLNQTDLKKHQDREDANLSFKCELCSRTYHARSELRDHMNTHTGQKGNVCKLCGKAYFWSGGLRRHMRKQHPAKTAVTAQT